MILWGASGLGSQLVPLLCSRQFLGQAKNATRQAPSKPRDSYTVTSLALAAERGMSLRKLVDGKAADA